MVLCENGNAATLIDRKMQRKIVWQKCGWKFWQKMSYFNQNPLVSSYLLCMGNILEMQHLPHVKDKWKAQKT